MTKARELLEYAKQAGWIDLAPGIRFATREYLQGAIKRASRVVEISPGHKIEIMKGVNFDAAPFWFFAEPGDGDPLSKVQFHSAENEGKALVAIEAIIAFL